MNIIEAINSEKIFRPLFGDLKSWQNWIVALKAVFDLPLDKEELKIYRKYNGRKKPPENSFKEVFLIAGRRSGKSFISAIIAVYLAVFKDWRQHLRPGEIGYIMCIASDRKQAGVVLNYIKAILRLPIFKNMIQNEIKEEIALTNQTTIAVHTCSYRSLRGYTILAAICDEIAFWRSEYSANPAKEVLTALRPALATVPGSMLLGISTPYSRTGPLYESFRDKYGQNDPDALVWKAPTKAMNPTIQDRVINKALKEDYSAGRAEWLAEFREDTQALLPPELVDEAIVSGRLELPVLKDAFYLGFCDPSAGRQDSFSLAIAHRDETTGRIVLDCLREARPPFRPEEVVKSFSETLKSYNVFQIECDRFGGEWVVDAFRRNSIHVENSSLSKNEIYLAVLPMFSNRSIELLDNKRLRSQLCALERRTRSGGRDQVDNFFGHDDLANVVAAASVLASQVDNYPLPPPSYGISEPVETEKQKVDRETRAWLLDKPKKKPKPNLRPKSNSGSGNLKRRKSERIRQKMWCSDAIGEKK